MTKALFVIDVQNDFCEGGSLAVSGGSKVASEITEYLAKHKSDYDFVIASRDWHDASNNNGGHFAQAGETPDFVNSWPVHCVAGTHGAEYHPNLDLTPISHHIQKGQGQPAYSIFEGVTSSGQSTADLLQDLDVTSVDVVGLATDYCVLASALDAKNQGLEVRVLSNLVAGVTEETSQLAKEKLAADGCQII
ncbi:MAG: hypothetical protein RLZZ380_1017 [Actinomycetota bacterium]|jgi:nicotinamidase/pyrazinamidase